MDKRTLLLLVGAVPAMRTGATILRFKDDNSTGADDLVAELMERNARLIETYLLTGKIPEEFYTSLPADLVARL